MGLEAEVETLKSVRIFRGLDPRRLKLIAFTSQRLAFRPGDILFRQGDESEFSLRHPERRGRRRPRNRYRSADRFPRGVSFGSGRNGRHHRRSALCNCDCTNRNCRATATKGSFFKPFRGILSTRPRGHARSRASARSDEQASLCSFRECEDLEKEWLARWRQPLRTWRYDQIRPRRPYRPRRRPIQRLGSEPF